MGAVEDLREAELKLGYEFKDREHGLGTRKRYWRASHLKPLEIAMSNAYWEAQGYKSFRGSWSRQRPA